MPRIIGNATLHHGESLQLLREMPSESVDAVLTDPPYSSGGLHAGARQQTTSQKYVNSKGRQLPDFHGDNRDKRSYAFWATLWLTECYRIARPGAPCLIFSDWRQLPTLTDALQAGGWTWRNVVVWDKASGRPSLGEFRRQTEYVLYGVKGRFKAASRKCLPGVFRYTLNPNKKVHIAEKPVPLLHDLLQITPEASTILDPFMGSGTTAAACIETGRNFVGMELSKTYYETACERLEYLTP